MAGLDRRTGHQAQVVLRVRGHPLRVPGRGNLEADSPRRPDSGPVEDAKPRPAPSSTRPSRPRRSSGNPDLEMIGATFLYEDADGCHFMDQGTFETLTLLAGALGEDLLAPVRQPAGGDPEIQRCADRAVAAPLVELTVTNTEPGVRGDTASGGVTKPATLYTGPEIRARSSSRKASGCASIPKRASSQVGPEAPSCPYHGGSVL